MDDKRFDQVQQLMIDHDIMQDDKITCKITKKFIAIITANAEKFSKNPNECLLYSVIESGIENEKDLLDVAEILNEYYDAARTLVEKRQGKDLT